MVHELDMWTKGKEALEKKKFKLLYFRPCKRLFGSEERELNGGERSVFDVINTVNN